MMGIFYLFTKIEGCAGFRKLVKNYGEKQAIMIAGACTSY